MFSSVDEFLEAYNNGTLRRLPPRPDQTTDLDWSTRIRPNKTAPRDLDHLPGPRQVSFAGLRFRVDRELQYVSWLGWGLYLGFNRDMGLSLWDIRFLGDRIVYEVCRNWTCSQRIQVLSISSDIPSRRSRSVWWVVWRFEAHFFPDT